MKTSSRIALQFTLFTALLTLVLIIFINLSFFFTRHYLDRSYLNHIAGQQDRMQAVMKSMQQNDRRVLQTHMIQQGRGMPGSVQPPPIAVIESESGDNETGELIYSRRVTDIIQADDDRRYMVLSDDRGQLLLDISENLGRQGELAAVSFLIWIIITSISYLLSRRVVKRGLKDLYTLADGVHGANIENLDRPLVMEHLPADDEINIVAQAIDTMKWKINAQVQSIKDFVSHVSHEFKNPLMVIRSDIDLARKTGNVDGLLDKNTQTVHQMQSLLDGLFVLTTSQTWKMHLTELSLSEIVQRVCTVMEKKYHHKHIILKKNIIADVYLTTHEWAAESIFTNILDNAYKYTPTNGTIEVTLTTTQYTVSDTGIGIPTDHLEKVRQAFRQADKNREDGVGLGLAIVQKLCEVLGRRVDIASKTVPAEQTGTTVTISFIHKKI